MECPIESISWKRAGSDEFTDITDVVNQAVLSATPHPDDAIDNPKGYKVELVLSDDGRTLAGELQEALMDVEPATVRLNLVDVDGTFTDVSVGVSKVPHLPDQMVAELSVQPESHSSLHDYF